MISISLHGIVAVSSTLHSKEDSHWVDLELALTRDRTQEITLFFETYELAEQFHAGVCPAQAEMAL